MFCYLGIVLSIVFFTRLLAYWGITVLKAGDITLIPQILYLSYVENRGAAFGIFQDAKVFLIVVPVILFLAITYYVVSRRKHLKLSLLLPLSMVAGGGISNVADRLSFGYVVDYIDVRVIRYPVFNLADICVVLGVFWIAGYILFSKDTKQQ
ncbi:MAG: signal peptidase II [Clostridia bacterium]|nr:signal peptidase II [Clostridia bacterium]